MKCEQFRANLPDWLTNRLAPHHHADMTAHSAACPTCADCEREERRLRAAWQDLPARHTLNLLPRLTDRLSDNSAPRPRWGAYFTVAGTACVLAASAWLYVGRIGPAPVSYPAESVIAQSLGSPPLEDMLEGVRWRSSGEWDAQSEPLDHDVQMRSLLLGKETK
ncbi:MAG: hypothetical protein H7145_03385 [Akkermansiaceae bacterium]|nr:hypothetical protein [Armatimonadota bacterium]